jgi:hypothetical protein
MSTDKKEFKVGQLWADRCGRTRRISCVDGSDHYFPIEEELGGTCTTTGASLLGQVKDADLVELVQDVPTAEHSTHIPAAEEVTDTYVSPTGALRKSVGKAPLGYLPLDLCEGAAKVMQYGAVKYSPGNYRKGFPPVEALHSLMRHVAAVQAALESEDKDGGKGLLLDPESQQAHIHHVVTSALILIQSMKLGGYQV